MIELWQALALNIASLALFVWLWTRLNYRLGWAPKWARDGLMGLVMGFAGMASIYSSVEIAPGSLFDLRTVPVVLAAYVAGPFGGLLAGCLSAGYRYGLGGVGAGPAVVGIGFAALAGIFGNFFKGLAPTVVDALILSVVTALLPYLTAALVVTQGHHEPHWAEILPLAIARGVGMFVALSLVIHEMHQAREQLLLRTAFEHVPDYFYVKDRELRLVAVNKKVAEHHHFDSPRHLVGKTDHDLVRARRADRLASRESGLLSNPSIPLHEVEKVIGDDGIERWFDTAKVALRGPDGEVVGLVGVTRDVTKAREVERDAEEGRDLFGLVLEEMPAGVALFDKDGVLRYSNARYRSTFPLTGHLRVPGANIRDILAGVVESGEQLGVGDDAARWIDDVTSALATTSDEEIALFDGTWMHLRTRPTGSGASLVVVSDVTSIKGPEKALLEMTDQLAKIATVDGMTGLLTRRAFDGRLRAAVRASEVNREAISLLMTDVDHFKLYNDTYGHLAGDVCLGRVAHALAAAVRDGDVVGRYGGEEFAAVLPKAGGQEAIEIAKRVLERLAEAAEPHSGSPLGYVTVSVGIASYEFDRSGRTPAELVKRADDALYQSKADGRARVTLWDSDPIDVEWSAT